MFKQSSYFLFVSWVVVSFFFALNRIKTNLLTFLHAYQIPGSFPSLVDVVVNETKLLSSIKLLLGSWEKQTNLL